MNISLSSLRKFNVVIAVPDTFHRQHTIALVDLFLKNLKFHAIYIHLESVLAAYGAGQNLCCVVDIGADKLSVCCVEDGSIIKNTLFRKNFGSRDIDFMLKQ